MASKTCPCCGSPLREKGEPPSFKAFWSAPRRAEETVPVRSPSERRISGASFSAEQAALLRLQGIIVEVSNG